MSNVQQLPKDAVPDFRLRPLPGIIRHVLFASAGALLVQGATLERALAGPQGGNVAAGQGQINTPNATTTVVQQQSHSLVVNWQTFNVAKNELVQFNQPSASASVLNRVLNQTASQIFGSVNANGKVFLLNPSGVVIGKSARVNVGSLFMSSLDINDDDFMNGRYQFAKKDGSPAGAIINRGLIQAATGGSVTLVGEQVSNEGVIVADAGHVNLAAGRTATVDFNGDGLVHFEVDGEVLENASGADAAVSNSGEIRAEGGQVLLTASMASQVFDRAVNNSGLIRAGSIQKVGGKVTLNGFGGGVANTGTIDASGISGGQVRMVSDSVIEQFGTARADGSSGDGGLVHLASADTTLLGGDSLTSVRSDAGKGGLVEVLGERVGLLDNARVDASGTTGGGKVLLGGDYQGANADVQNAKRTYVGSGASIDVSAANNGDGGTAIVWGDEITRFYGSISGRGGEQGGNGGFAEVSGKHDLRFAGHVDLSAQSGQTGTLLLDPENIEIVADGTGGAESELDGAVGDDTFSHIYAFAEDPAATVLLEVSAVTDQLALTSVILQAHDDITVSEAVDVSGVGGAAGNALTLEAGDDILVSQSITLNGGALNLIAGSLSATATATVDGTVTINADMTAGSVAIDTSGDVTVATGVTVATSDNAAGDSGSIVIGTDAGTRIGGALTLTGTAELLTGAATVTDVATVQTGSISVFATGAVGGTGSMETGVATGTDTAADATDVTATSGAISVDSSANIAQLKATTGAADTDSTTDTDAAAVSGSVTLTGLGIGTTAAAAVTIDVAADANANTNETQGTLSLTSTSADAAGNITATMATNLNLGTVSNVFLTTAGTAQTIDLSAPTVSIATGGFSVGTDNLVLRATAGAIDDGTAGTGGDLLSAAILALSATTGIDVSTATGSIAATTTGASDAIFIENTGALNVNDAADTLGLTAGDAIVSNDGDITVSATGGSLTVTEDIAAGTASVALTTTGGTSHILGAGGTASTSNGATGLVLNAGGGVGVGGALNSALSGTGLLSITTVGTTTDGNVTVIEANALPIANVAVATDGSAQTISLTASSGDVTLGAANIGDAADDLSLTSTLGEVAGGAGVATANVLSLSAATGIGVSAALSTATGSIGAATTAGNIDIDNAFATTTTVTALTTAGA
ncbi:MAG: filamentous hemagglutinin family protein, partial [Gammaproteobacteria bacterium]